MTGYGKSTKVHPLDRPNVHRLRVVMG